MSLRPAPRSLKGPSLPRRMILALLLTGLPVAAGGQAQGSAPTAFQIAYRAKGELKAPLEVRFHAMFPPGYRVYWQLGDGTETLLDSADLTHTYYRPGSYTVNASLLDPQGRAVGRARGQVEVRSGGPERTELTVLLGRGGLRLSAVDSVLYSPARPQLLLNGLEIGAQAVQVENGAYQAVARATTADGRPLERRLTFTVAPLGPPSVAFESEVLRLTNRARARGWNCTTLKEGGPALPALTPQVQLDTAALAQSAGMALFGYFDHVSGLDGSTPMRRAQAAGADPQATAENIAAGQHTPAEVVDAWLRSPGHCKNIMGNFTHIGLSYVNRPGTTYVEYWTQVFARF